MLEHVKLPDGLKTISDHKVLFYTLLMFLPIITGFICIGIGRYSVPLQDTVNTILAHLRGQALSSSDQIDKVVWSMRIPRILLALLVGGGLPVAGTAFQSLFSNPLATPDTLGVAAGASFGAVVGLYFNINLLGVQFLALLTGFSAVALTYIIGMRKESREQIAMVVLGGMVISSIFSALVSLIKFIADSDSQLPSITYWLMGSLSSANYYTLMLGAPFIIIGCVLLFKLRWRINILSLSEDEARSMGTNILLLRFLTVLSSTMITASCVSMCGQVGWVGLLIPHICRMAFGSDNTVLVPSSIGFGATFMVIIDTVARSATASEVPISILTALIGAPFFIALLRKSGGWSI